MTDKHAFSSSLEQIVVDEESCPDGCAVLILTSPLGIDQRRARLAQLSIYQQSIPPGSKIEPITARMHEVQLTA